MSSVSYWQDRNRAEPIEADVAIVGGGIAGCSTAFWLKTLDPSLDVVLIEKDSVAAGATGRNAGFLLQGSSTAYALDVDRLGRQNARLLWTSTLENRNLIASLFSHESIGLQTTGSCTAAGTEREAAALTASYRLLSQDGFDAEYLDAPDLNGLLDSNGFLGGLIVPTGAVLDPVRLVREMLSMSGVRVYERLPVRSVTEGEGGAVLLDCGLISVHADSAVITINAYLPLLEPDLADRVRPVRAQMLSTSVFEGKPLPMPVYSHDGYYYIRQSYSGGLMLGGARHLHRAAEEGYSTETSESVQNDLARYLRAYFPSRAGVSVERRWAGTMGFSPDGLPVWGRLPDVPRAVWLGGFTGHGMSIAFLLGRMTAQYVLDESESELLQLFRADRLGS